MGRLTTIERVKKTFACEPVDRAAIKDIIHNIPVLEYYGGDKITPSNAFDVTCRALSNACDLTRAIGIPDDLEPRVVHGEDGYVYKVDWWTTSILSRPFRTAEELGESVKRDIEDIYDSMSKGKLCYAAQLTAKLTGQGMSTPEELKVFFEKLVGTINDCVVCAPESIVGLTTAYSRAGLDLFSYLYMDNPELVSKWLEALCDYEVWRINNIANAKLMPIAMTADDIAYYPGLMFSKEFLKKEFYPRLKRCNDAWKANGCKIIFHTDGDKNSIMDDLIGTGIDAINPLEPQAKMVIKDLRKKYPQLVFTGMIDQVELLPKGTAEEVRLTVRKCIEDANRLGIFIGSSTEVHPGCNPNNVIAMYEEAKSYPLDCA